MRLYLVFLVFGFRDDCKEELKESVVYHDVDISVNKIISNILHIMGYEKRYQESQDSATHGSLFSVSVLALIRVDAGIEESVLVLHVGSQLPSKLYYLGDEIEQYHHNELGMPELTG